MVEPLEPVLPEPSAVATVAIEPAPAPPPAPPKKRRICLRWLIAVVVLLVVLVVAFVVAEAFAKDYAKNYVRERIVEVLKLDPATDVDVDLGTGSVILQAISGSISEVTVDVAELSFGDITASAVISAAGVPLDGAQPVDTLGIVATVTEANVRKLAGFMSGTELKSIELGDAVITVGTEFTILGFFVIPITVDLVPSAVSGGISFDPKTITLGGEDISVQDLRDSPEFSALAGDLLNSRDFCLASSLPKALTITDVDVVGSNLVIAINGDGAALSGPGLSELGVCKQK